MAKDVVIQKDGTSHTYQNVKKIKVKAVDGGNTTWVPYDEVHIFPKTITANGTYKAADDEMYGYEYVDVNVSGITVGKKDGKDIAVTTDANGYIMEMTLPDEIRIAKSPTKMTYVSGEAVDISGIVIKAYAAGDLWTTTSAPDGNVIISEVSVSPAYVTSRIGSTVHITWPRPIDNKPLTIGFQVIVL